MDFCVKLKFLNDQVWSMQRPCKSKGDWGRGFRFFWSHDMGVTKGPPHHGEELQKKTNCSVAPDPAGIFSVVVTLQAVAVWSAFEFYCSQAPLSLVMIFR